MKSRYSLYRSSYWTTLFVVLCLALFSATDLNERWELSSQDARFAVRGVYPHSRATGVVIIEIAESTLKTWENEPTLFWGPHFAASIQAAFHNGASVVGLDFIPELMFSDFAAIYQLPLDDPNPIDRPLLEMSDLFKERLIFSQLRDPRTQQLHSPYARLLDRPGIEALRVGLINMMPQSDSKLRRMLLYAQDEKQIHPSFDALLVARLRKQEATSPETYRKFVPNSREFWVNYVFRTDYQGHPFPHFKMEDVIAGLGTEDTELFRGSVVLIGFTAAGERESYPTPVTPDCSGVEIHAHAVHTLLNHQALKRFVPLVEVGIVFCCGSLATLLLLLLPFRAGSIVIPLASLGWLLLAQAMFQQSDTLLPVVGPFLAILVPFGGFHASRAVIEGRLLARMRPYTPEVVTQTLLRGVPQLGGTLFDVSILFFDLRGSTETARYHDPTDVMSDLNILFERAYRVLQAHGGVLSLYIGDGFMAIFGAPHRLKNHAQAATDAALELLATLHTLNQERQEKDANQKPYEGGCGIATGDAVCGNLGSLERMVYTAIGETVNIASRLEGQNKVLNSQLVLSETTYQRLHNPPSCQKTEVKIDSREQPITVYYYSASQ